MLKGQQAQATQAGDTENKVLEVEIPEMPKQYTFTDITSHGIGVIIQNEYGEDENSVILNKGVKVPAEHSENYTTTVPYQEKLYVQVTQGEEKDVRYVSVIGTAEIQIPAREKIVGIRVTVSCDENSIIHVRVFDKDLGRDLGEMKIDRVSNLSDEEIQKNQQRISKLDISGD